MRVLSGDWDGTDIFSTSLNKKLKTLEYVIPRKNSPSFKQSRLTETLVRRQFLLKVLSALHCILKALNDVELIKTT